MARPKSNEPKTLVSFRLDAKIKDMLAEMAAANHRSMTGQLEWLIEAATKKMGAINE